MTEKPASDQNIEKSPDTNTIRKLYLFITRKDLRLIALMGITLLCFYLALAFHVASFFNWHPSKIVGQGENIYFLFVLVLPLLATYYHPWIRLRNKTEKARPSLKHLIAPCPIWMRYIARILSIYAVLTFGCVFFLGISNPSWINVEQMQSIIQLPISTFYLAMTWETFALFYVGYLRFTGNLDSWRSYNDEDKNSSKSTSIFTHLKSNLSLLKQNSSIALMIFSLVGFSACIMLASVSIIISEESEFLKYMSGFVILGIFFTAYAGNKIHPSKDGQLKYKTKKVHLHVALANCPLWLKGIVLIYWVILFILLPFAIQTLANSALFLFLSGFYLLFFAQLYGDHTNPNGQRSKRPRKPKPKRNKQE